MRAHKPLGGVSRETPHPEAVGGVDRPAGGQDGPPASTVGPVSTPWISLDAFDSYEEFLRFFEEARRKLGPVRLMGAAPSAQREILAAAPPEAREELRRLFAGMSDSPVRPMTLVVEAQMNVLPPILNAAPIRVMSRSRYRRMIWRMKRFGFMPPAPGHPGPFYPRRFRRSYGVGGR